MYVELDFELAVALANVTEGLARVRGMASTGRRIGAQIVERSRKLYNPYLRRPRSAKMHRN